MWAARTTSRIAHIMDLGAAYKDTRVYTYLKHYFPTVSDTIIITMVSLEI
jgi:hypothetical protein